MPNRSVRVTGDGWRVDQSSIFLGAKPWRQKPLVGPARTQPTVLTLNGCLILCYSALSSSPPTPCRATNIAHPSVLDHFSLIGLELYFLLTPTDISCFPPETIDQPSTAPCGTPFAQNSRYSTSYEYISSPFISVLSFCYSFCSFFAPRFLLDPRFGRSIADLILLDIMRKHTARLCLRRIFRRQTSLTRGQSVRKK